MNWFRFYHDALDDPKVQRLEPALFKAWVNLLCLASRADERGTLPCVDDIAFALRIPEDEADQIIAELVRRGLLEEVTLHETLPVTSGCFHVHNWNGRQRQSDDVAERVRKHRESQSISPKPQSPRGKKPVTLQKRYGNGLDTEQNRVDTEQNRVERTPRATKKSATPDVFEPDEALLAWAATEHGVDKPLALKETAKFLDHHRSVGSRFSDWRAAWRKWIGNVQDYAPKARGSPANIRPLEPKRAPKSAFHLVHDGERS